MTTPSGPVTQKSLPVPQLQLKESVLPAGSVIVCSLSSEPDTKV